MDLSFFTMPLHPLERNYVETLREDREAIILADRLGFKEAFIGEHVTDSTETITSAAVFIASLISETRRIKLGTGTVNLPNHHPAQVAATIAMLDHMLEGRFLFGIGPGGLASDMEMFGNLGQDRTAMFVEAIDHVLALWTTDPPYDRVGKYWTLSTARTLTPEVGQGVMLKPYQKPHPPILSTAVVPFSKGLVAVGERGWLPISANFLQAPWVASHWGKYAEGRAKAGAVADRRDWRVARSIFVADDTATARRYVREAGSPYRYYYNNLLTKLLGKGQAILFKQDRDQPDETVTLDHVVDSLVISGTAEEVVDRILALREVIGDFGTILYAGHDWVDPALARRSMELMADNVMPAINRAL